MTLYLQLDSTKMDRASVLIKKNWSQKDENNSREQDLAYKCIM